MAFVPSAFDEHMIDPWARCPGRGTKAACRDRPVQHQESGWLRGKKINIDFQHKDGQLICAINRSGSATIPTLFYHID